MIRTISGTITHILPDGVVIESHGVGYLVSVPARSMPRVNSSAHFFTFHYIKEDAQALFGFRTLAELTTFQQLLTVPSVGPKLAMAISSAAIPAEIASAIEADNLGFFQSLPGVGKKSAAKIIVELKGKITAKHEVTIPSSGTELAEALGTLGYSGDEIQSVLKTLPADLALQEQVSWALKELAR